VYQHVRRYAQNPTDEFVKGLLSGPMSELAAGCGAQIVPETTPRGTFTVRVKFDPTAVHSAPPAGGEPSDKAPGYHRRMEASDLAATRFAGEGSPESDGEEAGALGSTVRDASALRPPPLQAPAKREAREASYSPSFEPESPDGGMGREALREALHGSAAGEGRQEGDQAGSGGGGKDGAPGGGEKPEGVVPGVHMIDGVALPNTEGMSAQDEWRTRQLYRLLMQA